MLTLPAGIASHIDDDVYVAAHLVELQGIASHYWCDYSQDLVWPATTISLAVSSGSQTVTPVSMTGIVVGMSLTITNLDGTNSEVVVVTSTASSTFTATFATSKASGSTVRGRTWLNSSPFVPSVIVTDANGIQDVTLTFDEQSQIIQAIDQNEGMSDRTIILHEAWIDTVDGVTVLGVMQNIASGTTGGLDFDETGSASTGTLILGSGSAMTSQNGPRNSYDLSCQNGFGDARCKIVPAATTVALSVAVGSHAVTPASMANILVGVTLDVANADGKNAESVVVTAVTVTTFTATLVLAKTAAWTVRGKCDRTFAGGCTAYSNQANFRGCRHALTPPFSVAWGTGTVVLTSRIFPGQTAGIP